MACTTTNRLLFLLLIFLRVRYALEGFKKSLGHLLESLSLGGLGCLFCLCLYCKISCCHLSRCGHSLHL